MSEYQIHMGNEVIGTAQITREGLYYSVVCLCKLPEKAMYRLMVSCEATQLDLGILLLEGDVYTLKTKLPCKRLGEGAPVFRVVTHSDAEKRQFVPISSDIPFNHISRLERAQLQIVDGSVGVLL